jgi:VanZ family protein
LFKTNSLKKFTILIFYLGTITELIQLWVPERTFNVFDLLSNIAGLLIGLGVIIVAGRKFKIISNQ